MQPSPLPSFCDKSLVQRQVIRFTTSEELLAAADKTNQYPAHHSRRDGENVGSILPFHLLTVNQSHEASLTSAVVCSRWPGVVKLVEPRGIEPLTS